MRTRREGERRREAIIGTFEYAGSPDEWQRENESFWIERAAGCGPVGDRVLRRGGRRARGLPGLPARRPRPDRPAGTARPQRLSSIAAAPEQHHYVRVGRTATLSPSDPWRRGRRSRRAHGVGAGSRERSGARGGTKDGLAPGPRGGRRRARGPEIRGTRSWEWHIPHEERPIGTPCHPRWRGPSSDAIPDDREWHGAGTGAPIRRICHSPEHLAGGTGTRSAGIAGPRPDDEVAGRSRDEVAGRRPRRETPLTPPWNALHCGLCNALHRPCRQRCRIGGGPPFGGDDEGRRPQGRRLDSDGLARPGRLRRRVAGGSRARTGGRCGAELRPQPAAGEPAIEVGAHPLAGRRQRPQPLLS